MTPALEARHVYKSFASEGNTVLALHDVMAVIEPGEYVAITGPSGSGKSTLLHLLGGLDEPSSGDVLVDGTALGSLGREERARLRNRRIGFVFQFFNLLPSLTALENVTLPAVIGRIPPAVFGPKSADLLARVGLAGKGDRFPAQLSGGEQQRLAIARALVMAPAVLLADEPTGNLDSAAGAQVLDLLDACHHEGQSIVIVTHDVRVATRAQRVIYLRDGRVVDDTKLDTRARRETVVSRMVQVGDDDSRP